MADKLAGSFTGTMAVQDKHQFDVARLHAYMAEHVEGFSGELSVAQFKGGQSNPTYKLNAGGKDYVLRRKPPGALLASAHAVDREYRVMTALASTDVPVAKTYSLCEDESVIGTPFYIMDCVNGRVLWDPELPDLSPGERTAIFEDMNRVMAALHSVDYTAIGLESFGKAGNYFERQISRWSKQYRASEIGKIEAMERLIEWLPDNIPEGDDTAIVHGDFRLDNMMLHPTEPRIIAVLDWELSTLGHPLADFAYHCMTWHLPNTVRGLAGTDLKSIGIPSEAEHIKDYCQRTNKEIDPRHWDFYMAYNMFRLAGILQGIMGRVKSGTAASKQAEEMGSAAKPLAELAWHQVEKMQSRT
ncbi:MAG: aminoglycoside phosphotransferase (APT) family kinase protein [Bermanella sp.]|jgi:aminoglycoside phosphotransferase (APT) family kinase protein